MSIILRYVYHGIIHERFVGYTHATELNATPLYEYILQPISEMQVDIKGCICQYYDGASVMSGECAGVSAKILERNTKAVYIHCCAHRLNLALVDTVKAVTAAEDFFSFLQMPYVFMSSSKAHEIFLEQQKVLKLCQEIRLKKLSDTRWACRHSSIKAIAATVKAVIVSLEIITDGEDREKAVEANGLLVQVKKFQFLLCLLTFQQLFGITVKLSDVLQAEKLDFAGAVNYIEATITTLQSQRTETGWKNIWEKATSMATSLDIPVKSPRPVRKDRWLPSRLRDMLVTAETVGNRSTPVDVYCVQLYYASLDQMIGEMHKQFDKLNLSLMKAMQALSP